MRHASKCNKLIWLGQKCIKILRIKCNNLQRNKIEEIPLELKIIRVQIKQQTYYLLTESDKKYDRKSDYTHKTTHSEFEQNKSDSIDIKKEYL